MTHIMVVKNSTEIVILCQGCRDRQELDLSSGPDNVQR